LRHGCYAPLSECAVAAAYNGHDEIVRYLLAHLDAKQDYAYNITNASTFSANSSALVTLLRDHKYPFGIRALFGAAARGDHEMMQSLIADFMSPLPDIGQAALSQLAAGGHLQLYQHYTKSYTPDMKTETAVQVATAAAAGGHIKFLEYLLSHNKLAFRGNGVISSSVVVKAGQLAALEWALKHNLTTVSGPTLAAACQLGDIRLIDYFYDKHNVEFGINGVCEAARCGHLDVLKRLQEMEPHAFDAPTRILTAAAQGGHLNILIHYQAYITEDVGRGLTWEAGIGGFLVVLNWLELKGTLFYPLKIRIL